MDHGQRRPQRGARRAGQPDYELVGVYAHGADKAGRDTGELIGTEPTGILATNDIDLLLALCPDVVSYNPIWLPHARCRGERWRHALRLRREPGLPTCSRWCRP